MEYTACNYCGSENYRVLHRISVSDKTLKFYRHSRNSGHLDDITGKFNIVTCSNCGLVYTNPRSNIEQLDAMYSSNTILGGNWKNFPYLFNKNLPDELQDLGGLTNSYDTLESWKERIFRKYAGRPEGLKLLDVGCGAGKFVRQCVDSGIDAYGMDLSGDRIDYGRREYSLGERIWEGTLNAESIKGKTYDIITMWDVIEHVPNPTEILREIKLVSNENTRLFILTMSLDSLTYKIYGKRWFYIHPPQHLHYFSHKSMENMLAKCGFELSGIEMDHTYNKNVLHLLYRIIVGAINHLLFQIWRIPIAPLKWMLSPFTIGISDNRMLKRFENIQPSLCAGRYKDNFVYVASLSKSL